MIKEMQEQVLKGLGQIRQSFLGLVSRAGSTTVQLKGFEAEVLDDVEVMQQVGFASWLPEGTKVILIPQQGKTAKSIVVATKGGKVVIDVAEGETCIYDQFGHSVWLKEDGTHIAGDLFVDGNIEATNDIKDKKSTMQSMRDTYNSHRNGSDTTTPDKAM